MAFSDKLPALNSSLTVIALRVPASPDTHSFKMYWNTASSVTNVTISPAVVAPAAQDNILLNNGSSISI